MRKSILITAIVAASALSLPAFAQIHVGAGVGAGVNAGSALHGAAQTANGATIATENTLDRTGRAARHTAHKAAHTAPSTGNGAQVQTGASVNGSAGANAGDAHAGASANVDASAGKH